MTDFAFANVSGHNKSTLASPTCYATSLATPFIQQMTCELAKLDNEQLSNKVHLTYPTKLSSYVKC